MAYWNVTPESYYESRNYSSNVQSAAPWSSSMEMFKGLEVGHLPLEDKAFDMYGYNPPYGKGIEKSTTLFA